MTYKQIAQTEGVTEQTIKNRMSIVMRLFGANSMPHLVAVLIASDVLRLADLYQEVDVHIREYRRTGRRRSVYQLCAVRI